MTQIEQLDEFLRNGGTITVLEAMLPPFNCCSLSQRMGELRRDYAKPVVSETVKLDSGKRIKRYRYVMIGEQQALRLEAHDEAPGNRPHSAANGR